MRLRDTWTPNEYGVPGLCVVQDARRRVCDRRAMRGAYQLRGGQQPVSASGVQPPKDTREPGKSLSGEASGQEQPSAVYSATYAMAAEYGPEVAIETTAQCLDIYWPGVGDILRDAWRLLVQEILQMGPAAAASSGAEHELEFYGGAL